MCGEKRRELARPFRFPEAGTGYAVRVLTTGLIPGNECMPKLVAPDSCG